MLLTSIGFENFLMASAIFSEFYSALLPPWAEFDGFTFDYPRMLFFNSPYQFLKAA